MAHPQNVDYSACRAHAGERLSGISCDRDRKRSGQQPYSGGVLLAGKLLIPFITHGGYGKGDSDDILASLVPTARQEKPLVIECDQERRTTKTVTSWLETICG